MCTAAWISRHLVFAVQYAAVASAALATLAAFRRRWLVARRFARLTAATPVLAVASVLVGFFTQSRPDGSMKVTFLAQTISELLGCTALPLLCLVAVAPAWLVSARRIRRGGPPLPPRS